MKILIIRMYADVLNINSYNCQEIGLAKALIRCGNDCDIVLYTDKEEKEIDIFFDDNKKIHIYYLKAKSILKNAFYSKKLYEIVFKYDIVQSAEYDQIANVKLSKILKNKFIIYHGPYESRYTKGYKIKCLISDMYYIFHPKYKKVKCIAKSELAKQFLFKRGFTNVVTLGVGLDEDKFRYSYDQSDKVKDVIEQKKENNFKYLLYIGKIEERRNILFLFDIIKKVSTNDDSFKLILIGDGEEKYKQKCFIYAKKIGIFEKIIYINKLKQEELPYIYKESECLLLPTKYEIFGMILLEAIYFNTNVITTLNGGSSVLSLKSNLIKICNLNNIEEWEKEINKITYSKKDVNEKISISWNDIVDKFIEQYLK